MEERKIVVVVEEAEVARTALRWSLNNIVRHGDTITLLHVFSVPSNKSKKKSRLLRLKGFQLALSFQSICNAFPSVQAKVEIVVTEGDQDGTKIAAVVREIAASVLVIGLHDRSFLYKVAMAHSDIASGFSCRVLAIKQPPLSSPSGTKTKTNASVSLDCSTNMVFSQIELSGLRLPELPTPRIPYRICPSPSAIIWRSRKSRRK